MANIYRFDLEAKISQVIGIKAESKEEAHAVLKKILEEGGTDRSDTKLKDIKKGLRELGMISNVTINEEKSVNRWVRDEEDYRRDNHTWKMRNPNKDENGVWDGELTMTVKEAPKKREDLYDVQLFFECDPTEEYKELPFFDTKIYVQSEGSGYAEIRNITTMQFEMLTAALKFNYDLVGVAFDVTKLKDGKKSANYRNIWRAFVVRKKKAPEPTHVRPIYPNNPPPLEGTLTLVGGPSLFELLSAHS